MPFAAIIIGDEIMSGKRQDKHMAKAIETLKARGLQLSWCRYLSDYPDDITATLRSTLAADDVVFCFGGIGATPDDHTRQCAASAAGVELRLHPEAAAEIRARFGAEITPNRLKMGEFPEGAAVIPNPHNRIPGFSLCRHYFLPGFPAMAWPMMAWVLDTHYAHLFQSENAAESAIFVRGAGESQLIDLMNKCLADFPGIKLSSLPRMGADRYIELGVRGEPGRVAAAITGLKHGVSALGFTWADAP